uniref:Uncharacterized protein n=1 Tax=Candidatus Kentrum sp. SD TaxID=2126332 RepID=A0A450Y534_9GAMM|nr:MAG: hypothetical protein BECKSD772F_GA0070984_100369 [Candidatus Kentron sp. SD]VFK39541.1 MAG: hypothetical protein BECKSD772E_GA0070983_10035 [Candidatus Kentron sp. SD]VFK79343.1 MAG: hypothetical protein BECKSD772D_GA0070982_104526 [Candidatus Kentron sp. SD]
MHPFPRCARIEIPRQLLLRYAETFLGNGKMDALSLSNGARGALPSGAASQSTTTGKSGMVSGLVVVGVCRLSVISLTRSLSQRSG